MNKNIVKLFAILMMIFMIGSVLVACGTKGDQGDKGETGAPGATGEQGPQGPAGHSPYPGENGNWWYWDDATGKYVDSGVQVKGEDLRDCENHHWDKYEIVHTEHAYNAETGEATIGVVLRTCVDCGDSYFFEIGHEFVAGTPVAPTCQEEGYTIYTCDCGYSEKRDIVEKIDHIKGEKEHVKNEAGICDCEWNNPWFIRCTMCDAVVEEGADGANGHSYTEYAPIKPEGQYNPCTWVDGVAAQCDNCKCHIDTKLEDEPRGHKAEAWTVASVDVENDKIVLSYVCDDCGETVTKNITLADCKLVETPATCEKDGSKVYTYEYTLGEEAKSLHIYTEVLAKIGHEIAADSKYTVDLANMVVNVKCECEGCEGYAVIALPALNAENYTITKGECDYNYDTYEAVVAHKDVEIKITFVIEAYYGHNNDKLGEGAEWIVIDINDTLYDAYWCSTCQHWIAVREHV